MKLNIFSKDEKNKKKKAVSKADDVAVSSEEAVDLRPVEHKKFSHHVAGVIKSLYISEKSSRMLEMNKYTFKVTSDATKSEVAKEVENRYEVKVSKVAISVMPSKSRQVGRHSGIKPGYKKAVVTLKEGFTIDQARP